MTPYRPNWKDELAKMTCMALLKEIITSILKLLV